MISFVHTADVHFGVENYGKTDSQTGINTRLSDFKSNMDKVVRAAIDARVDFFVLCGDAYKTAHPTPTQQKLLMECLFKLYKAGIHVVIVVGNHDHPISFGRAHALDVFSGLPVDGFHVFSKPGSIKIQTKNGPVQVVGIPWPTRNNLLTMEEYRYKDGEEIVQIISNKVAGIVKGLAEKLDPSIPAILASHLTVTTGVFSGSEKRAIIGSDPMLMPSQLAIEPFNYIALGHLHRHQDLSEGGQIPIVYSGSIEAIDFGEIRDKKGFCLVNIDTKRMDNGQFHRVCENTFVPLSVRKMVELKVDVGIGLEQTEKLAKAIEAEDIDGAIVKISYHLPAGAADCVDLSRIQDCLKAASHVVCVKPVKPEQARRARINVESCQDVPTLLKRYLVGKGLESRMDTLLEKAGQVTKLLEDAKEESQS